MNKKQIIKLFIDQISEELNSMKSAALNTYSEATQEESKAENKYDTRGLEASYLAGAQAKRVEELQAVLAVFKNFPLKNFNDEDRISLTALIEVQKIKNRAFFTDAQRRRANDPFRKSTGASHFSPRSPRLSPCGKRNNRRD
jgi:hypothetical protein